MQIAYKLLLHNNPCNLYSDYLNTIIRNVTGKLNLKTYAMILSTLQK